jgi:hypothetical protein
MTHFRVNSPNVIHEIIDGEAVLVNLETGSYYSIDSVGAVVWDCVEKGLSLSQIVEVIAARYEGEQADIAAGIQRLFDDLQAEQLIVPGEATSTNGHTPEVNGTANDQAKLPFEAPMLHKYTDMEDLLLLDPIHDVDESGWPNTNPNNA